MSLKTGLRCLAVLVGLLPLVTSARPTAEVDTLAVPVDLYLATQEDVESAQLAMGWTHAGCIQRGTRCYDVFDDGTGTLWICKACFTTKNPNTGKCRKLSAWELANALWCA